MTVIGGYPISATTITDNLTHYPGKIGITVAEWTILDGSQSHRVADVAGVLEACVVLNGRADDTGGAGTTKGGGVLVQTGGKVQNCIIRGNQCHSKTDNDGKGGGAYLEGTAQLVNCIVDFNMAQQGCGVAGSAGNIVNCAITNNTNAPIWVKVIAGPSNYFPFNNITCTKAQIDGAIGGCDAYKTWFTNDYYLAQTECTVAQYAVYANAKQIPTGASQKTFTTDEAAGYYFTPSGSYQLFDLYTWGLKRMNNNLWVPNTGFENKPMVYVTWYGSLAFSQWIGGGTGPTYSGGLPSEAQWEFAARRVVGTDPTTGGCYSNNKYAGTNIDPPTAGGVQDYAWYSDNSSNITHQVGTKLSNAIGLYDMGGNGWESNGSWYGNLIPASYGADPVPYTTGSGRGFRGGGCYFPPSALPVSVRGNGTPTALADFLGFRPIVQ